MHTLDYVVLVGYFVVMIIIGVISAWRIKVQEDFFMGGRTFGKLLQTFAAFGAGTGAQDPINVGRTTYTSGMSGMWSVMYWLFVTPFYWITGVWYRRMRHLTLGDWYVERYESKSMGLAYCIFGVAFHAIYGSMMFSAIGKVAAPLIGVSAFTWNGQVYGIEYLLVPIIGVVVLGYGVVGGLRAAYFTDLIQGLCIILLSIILIPYGLSALVEKFGDPSTQSLWHGFRIMHEQLPEAQFAVIGTEVSEFPLHRIIAVVIINLIGVVVQPHFIATGGGSAKTEMNARVGLVVGNFLKRFCTVGWVLTALIAVALYASSRELVGDPDKTWGIASRELLGPGLTGLMLACLLAALMSSIDAYMIVDSALVVRNGYAAFINPNATEKEYVRVARLTGVFLVGASVLISLFMMDVFAQLQLTWVFGIIFAAPFWIGMYWRRATTAAAWTTVAFSVLTFFLVPAIAPAVYPSLRTQDYFLTMNRWERTVTRRPAAPADVARREARIELWEDEMAKTDQVEDEAVRQRQLERLGPRPEPLKLGEEFETTRTIGGQSVFWEKGLQPIDEQGEPIDVAPIQVGEPQHTDEHTTRVRLAYPDGTRLRGEGNFRVDFLLYKVAGMDLRTKTSATLATLELPPKIISPFLVMILISFLTRPNSKEALDRYYAKMKTPVVPDHEQDETNLKDAVANIDELEKTKLFPGTSLEFQRPTAVDVIGFVVSVLICFAIIGVAVWVANIGG